MAILKKGIFGTPRGKIGNLMGYTRYGKGVLQTVPTVKDARARIWNIYQKQLYDQFGTMYDNLSASQQTDWNNNALPTETGREYCQRTNMEILNVDKINTVANGRTTYNSIFYPYVFVGGIDWEREIMTIDLIDGFTWWEGNPTPRISIRAYSTNNSSTSLNYNFPDQDHTSYQADISGIMNPNRIWITGTPVSPGAFKASRQFLCNPFRFI